MGKEKPGDREYGDSENPGEIEVVAHGLQKKRGGRVQGWYYLKTPAQTRALCGRVINLMLTGDLQDADYKVALEVWDLQMEEWRQNKRVGPAPQKPRPPKLDARTGTAVGNLIRCWLECRSSDIEKKIEELAATNAMLFKLIDEKRAKDAGNGGGKPH
jgi:hypothetical protein